MEAAMASEDEKLVTIGEVLPKFEMAPVDERSAKALEYIALAMWFLAKDKIHVPQSTGEMQMTPEELFASDETSKSRLSDRGPLPTSYLPPDHPANRRRR
jgi:hypothetical protein